MKALGQGFQRLAPSELSFITQQEIMISIIQLSEWPTTDMAPLVLESEQEGFRFLRRLREDWSSGANRFSKAGEALFGVFEDERLLAVGGINRESNNCGRLRRFFVKQDERRRGIGRMLVKHILQHASQEYDQVVLLTDTEAAGRFYVSLGFVPISDIEGHSHTIELKPALI